MINMSKQTKTKDKNREMVARNLRHFSNKIDSHWPNKNEGHFLHYINIIHHFNPIFFCRYFLNHSLVMPFYAAGHIILNLMFNFFLWFS